MATLTALQAASPLDANDGTRLAFTANTDNEVLERALDNVDADFLDMDTLSWQVDYRQQNRSDDTLGLGIAIVVGTKVLAGASETFASRFQTVDADVTNTTDTLTSVTAFTYVDLDADEAAWNNAVVQLQQSYTATMKADGAFVEVDFTEFTGTYTTDPGGTYDGPTHVAAGNKSVASPATTITISTTDLGASTGDFVAMVIGHEDGIAGVNDHADWTRITATGGVDHGDGHYAVVYRVIQAGDTSWTFANGGTAVTWNIGWERIASGDFNSASPIDASAAFADGSTDSLETVYADATQNNVLAIILATADAGAGTDTMSIDTGTERVDSVDGTDNVQVAVYTEEKVNAAKFVRQLTQSDGGKSIGAAIILLAPAAGTTVERTFTGSISTLTGALEKQARVAFEGAGTPAGALAKEARATFEGAGTPAGVLVKQGQVTFEGTGASTGTLLKEAQVTFEGSGTPAGALATTKVILLSVAGSISTLAGSLLKQAGVTLEGSTSSSGALLKQAQVTFEGGGTPSGALTNIKIKLLSVAGTISTLTGSLVKRVGKQTSGVITTAGALAKQPRVTFEGSETPTGSITKEPQVTFEGTISTLTGALSNTKVKLLSLAGSISTLTGALTKQVRVTFEGSGTPTGTLAKQPQKELAGSISTLTGALSNTKVKLISMAGTIATLTGSLVKEVGKLASGGVTPSGSLTKKASVTFEGNATSTGALATAKLAVLSAVGTITSAGALIKRVAQTTEGTVSSSGDLSKQVSLTILGVVSSTGSLVKRVSKLVVGSLSTAGSLATQKIVGGTVQTISRMTRRGRRDKTYQRKTNLQFKGRKDDEH